MSSATCSWRRPAAIRPSSGWVFAPPRLPQRLRRPDPMQRALFISDLHVDIERNAANDLKSLWQRLDFDVLMCAGDVRAPGKKALEWLASACPHRPVLYTPGNHDFYSFFDKH